MANEAVQVEGPYISHDWTVANGTAVEQFTLMVGSDPRTAGASTASTAAGVFAGIAMTEKKASDGQTNLGLTRTGVFDLTVNPNAGVTMGHAVVMSGLNAIRDAVAAELLTGAVVGHALETGTASEVIEVKLVDSQ